MCKKSTPKIKFRLVNPDCQRGRMFEATDIENLADLVTDRFGIYNDNLNVFWPEKDMIVGKIEPGRWPVRWWWKEEPDKFPQSIINFFDPHGDWAERGISQYDESNQRGWWTNFSLEIIGGVE